MLKNNKHGHRGCSRGFSLVELMVAVGALSAIVYVSTSLHLSSVKKIENKSTRNQILQTTKLLASSIDAVEYSMNKVPVLSRCIKSRNCKTDWANFNLYSPGSTALRAGSAPGMVLYSQVDGRQCNSGEPKCDATAVAQYRFDQDILETRINLLSHQSSSEQSPAHQNQGADGAVNTVKKDAAFRPALSDVATFRLTDFNSSFSCSATQAMIGIDTAGQPMCADTLLPGGGGSCSSGQVVTGMDTDGRVRCGVMPPSIDPSPIAGFLTPLGGRWTWQACSSIAGLNGLFPKAKAQFTCNWQTTGPCTVTRRRWVPNTCTACSTCYTSGTPSTPYSCNCYTYSCPYLVVDRVDSIVCNMSTSQSVTATSAGSFSCNTIRPTNCNTIALGPDDLISCPCFERTGDSGSVQCGQ